MRAKPTVTYPIYIGVFSCQDPEGTTFKLKLFDNLSNLLGERSGSAPPVSSPTLVGFSVPGKAGYQVQLFTRYPNYDFLTDMSSVWPTVGDTSPDDRTRAVYSSHSLSSLFPLAGSTVSFTLKARNVGRIGHMIACMHARDLYTLSELIPWTWGDPRYFVGTNEEASWTWSFTMPDTDIILDFGIYAYDYGYGQAYADYWGYVSYLYEDSLRTLTIRSDKTEVKRGETFTLSGEAKRGGKPLAKHPVWIYQKIGDQWYPLTWVATDTLGSYSVSLSGDQLTEGDNVFKALGVPTWSGAYAAKLGVGIEPRLAPPHPKLEFNSCGLFKLGW